MRRYNTTFGAFLIVVLVIVPFGWYAWGLSYDHSHPTDTVGGPLTIGLSIFLGVVCDALIVILAPLVWALGLFSRRLLIRLRDRTKASGVTP